MLEASADPSAPLHFHPISKLLPPKLCPGALWFAAFPKTCSPAGTLPPPLGARGTVFPALAPNVVLRRAKPILKGSEGVGGLTRRQSH